MEVIHEAPKTSSFVPLAEHQSATPASFYSGPPVLHYHSSRSKIVVLAADVPHCPPLGTLTNAYNSASKESATTNGHTSAQGNAVAVVETDGDDATDLVIADADIWVTSEYVQFSGL